MYTETNRAHAKKGVGGSSDRGGMNYELLSLENHLRVHASEQTKESVRFLILSDTLQMTLA